MSAIAGLLSLDHSIVEAEPAERMAAALAARGPHDDGSYRSPDGRAALAARRLATIDTKDGGQPLANETHDLWLVLDGEVLNHRALRHSLELVGHRFRTSSDAEVAVHAYEQWGLDFLDHLQGAFALALWDDRHDRLVLARDRLGRKPLFVAERRGHLAFASGIAPLLDELAMPRGIDGRALGQYLAFGFVPAPLTLAAGIEKLAAGEMLVAERGARPRRWKWAVPEPEQRRALGLRNLPTDQHLGNLRTLLECSIADRLIGDHPAGILLAANPAACAIASVTARFTGRPEAVIAVIDAHDRDGVAAREIRLLADWSRCELIESAIGADDVAAGLPAMVAALAEPVAEPGLIAAWFGARAAADARLRAVLDATGAEEVLLCHPAFDHARRGSMTARLANWLRATTRPGQAVPPPDWAGLLGAAALGPVPAPAMVEPTPPAWMATDTLAACGLRDLKGRMADAAAPGLDAMLQGHGIEGRLPFLDEMLLGYALAVPGGIRSPTATPRQTLRRLLGDLAPAATIARPPLPALPLENWLAGPLGGLVETLAARSALVRDDVLSADAIHALLARHRQSGADGAALWGMVMLLAWADALRLDGLAADGEGIPALAYNRS
jgi:asparagine synthase (glutamine-hydrolysing)